MMITWSDVAIVGSGPLAVALIAFHVLVYRPILGKIRRSRHPLIGAGHFATGCGAALVWGVVLAVVCLGLYAFLRNGIGV